MNNGPANVLLIEDNPGDADLVCLRLVEGYSPVNISTVNRLSDGLASMADKPPSVVLLDLNLPDSHGADTFRKVLEKAPGIPVVILSGQDDKDVSRNALDTLGRCVYLDKNLVLPVIGNAGTKEIFFVAASTDLERAEIMMKRIGEQLGPASKVGGILNVSAAAVSLPFTDDGNPLEELVQAVADRITEKVTSVLASKPGPEDVNPHRIAVQD